MSEIFFKLRLKEFRELKKWTQADLSRISNLSTSAISQYESGGREPGLEVLIKLANAFEITIDELIYKEIIYPREFEFEGYLCEYPELESKYKSEDPIEYNFRYRISSLYYSREYALGKIKHMQTEVAFISKWKVTMEEIIE